ncbi:COG4973: Site-specific recombinase XerC [hydrothermal vent metagenome]|uniref:COG4973: Site-specific recombinase XerC n=1 Tax=hydrothermal vent metagenome TaxID=652676 RepID=A0A3B0YD29_9ZZZZ
MVECISIRKIFKEAFLSADLQYFNPHSFRNTLVSYGQTLCSTPEDYKALSQNLGHEGVLTTFYSYGEVQPQRQAEIIKQLKSSPESEESNVERMAEALFQKMKTLKEG